MLKSLDVPVDVYFAAGLTSSIHADRGRGTQLAVDFARRAGVPAATIAAIVQRDEAGMSEDVALGARFARTLLARNPAVEVCRDEIAQLWGPRAVIALEFAVMAGRAAA